MATPEEVQRFQSEWEAEGVPAEEIGERLKRLADQSEAEAEATPEPAPEDEPAEEPKGAPSEEWPLCPVCGGNGRVPEQLSRAQDKQPCPECKGLGKVRTGSLVPENALADCGTCGGYGYTSTPREFTQEPPPPPPGDYQRQW